MTGKYMDIENSRKIKRYRKFDAPIYVKQQQLNLKLADMNSSWDINLPADSYESFELNLSQNTF